MHQTISFLNIIAYLQHISSQMCVFVIAVCQPIILVNGGHPVCPGLDPTVPASTTGRSTVLGNF